MPRPTLHDLRRRRSLSRECPPGLAGRAIVMTPARPQITAERMRGECFKPRSWIPSVSRRSSFGSSSSRRRAYRRARGCSLQSHTRRHRPWSRRARTCRPRWQVSFHPEPSGTNLAAARSLASEDLTGNRSADGRRIATLGRSAGPTTFGSSKGSRWATTPPQPRDRLTAIDRLTDLEPENSVTQVTLNLC